MKKKTPSIVNRPSHSFRTALWTLQNLLFPMFRCLRQDLQNWLLPPVLDFSIKYSAGIQEEAEAKGTTGRPSDKEGMLNFLLSQNKELLFMYPCQKEDYCHPL